MQRRISLGTLLAALMLTGCQAAEAPAMSVPRTGALTSGAEVAGSGFTLLASGQVSGWKKSDVDSFEVVVSHGDAVVSRVELPQQGDAPKSKARLSNLKFGKTYKVSVLALHAQQVINRLNPTELTFTFSGDQDVETFLQENVTIKLDDRPFSGNLTIPLSLITFGNNSRRLNVTLEAMVAASPNVWTVQKTVFAKDYPLPASGGYRDYQIWNLSYGQHYRVTLRSYNGGGANLQTLVSTIFLPFPDATETTYRIAPSELR
jgi:hypothetical protein